jgi:hypothetical protein
MTAELGVDTYGINIFGTLLSSQEPDAPTRNNPHTEGHPKRGNFPTLTNHQAKLQPDHR